MGEETPGTLLDAGLRCSIFKIRPRVFKLIVRAWQWAVVVQLCRLRNSRTWRLQSCDRCFVIVHQLMAPQRLKCGTSSWFGMSDTSDIWNIQQKRRKAQASFERFIHFSLMKHYNYIKENKHLFPFYKKASSPLKSKKKKKKQTVLPRQSIFSKCECSV